MCQFLMLGWAITVAAVVFVLYVRDPYASGSHSSEAKDRMPKLKRWLRGICDRLCSRGLCLSTCASPS